MIQQVLQHLTSTPEPEPDESDYEINIPSISERIQSTRRRKAFSPTIYSTPLKTGISPSSTHTPRTAMSVSRASTPLRRDISTTISQDDNQERDRIKEFVDVGKMIRALRTLESLISTPDPQYLQFKEGYVASTQQLIDAMRVDGAIDKTSQSAKHDNKDIMMGIIMVSVQILRLCIEMVHLFMLQLVAFWKELIQRPFVVQLTEIAGEIILVGLSLVLSILKSMKKMLNV
ncbi:hypothetical protein BON22_3700 [Cyberlindnera fabianii]|uniref:Uncharacterized protein n=1 Tax=Cyberlindnera fabianii TaxID=36022 RepID=A0A1V2L394_CYBFA|nr:hypothetical protein BON22_3700 [Cyberlindnera fabianii]